MTATAADIPQALAATAGPGELVPVAFLGRTSNERLAGPGRVDEPADPQLPRLAAARLPDRGLLLGRRIRRG